MINPYNPKTNLEFVALAKCTEEEIYFFLLVYSLLVQTPNTPGVNLGNGLRGI